MNKINPIFLQKSTESIINQIDALGRTLLKKLPHQVQWIAWPLICFAKFIWILPQLRLKLWILTGKERISNMPVCILYAGNDLAAAKVSSRNYLLNLILCDSFQERYMGRFWLWKISKAASETGQNNS